MDITPENLASELKKDIIGQDLYIRDLATALWMHHLKFEHFKKTGTHLENPKTNILAIGKSGSGKTLAIEILAKKILNLNLVIENASLLTGAGWKGNNVDTIALRAASAAGGDEDLEQYTVIVLDEFDKLFGNSRVKDTSFSPVANLLTFISGSTFTFGDKSNDNNKITVDTSHMLFIFLGAFNGLEKIIQNRISGKTSIGFNAAGYKKPPENDIFKHVNKDDLHAYGMPFELLGRIQTVTSLNELTCEDYLKVLLHSESSVIKQYDNMFSDTLGVHINITETAACYVAQQAKDNEMGARGLNQIVAEVLQPVVYELGSDNNISTLTLDVGDDGLYVEKIHGERMNVYEQLTLDEQYMLEATPFTCIRGSDDIWQYAKKIINTSPRVGKLLTNMVSAAKCIMAAAIALTLMDKKPYMTMNMLFQTLDSMSSNGISDNIYPLARMHNDFTKKAKTYGVGFQQARKTAESILLDYCQDYLMDKETDISTIMNIE